jgi:hypothetical protein
MKKPMHWFRFANLIVLCVLSWSVSSPVLAALPSAFTYDGRAFLDDGLYDFQFKLWTAASGGTQVGGSLTRQQVQLQARLFRVVLDFGPTAFTGENRYLEIGYRPASSTGAFTLLKNRFAIRPVPYAIHAESAADAVTADNADYAATSGNANYLDGWDSSAFHKGYSGVQVNQTTPLAAGGQAYWFTFGYSPNQLVVWRVLPTSHQGKLRLEVETEYDAAANTVTYYLRVFNTGAVPSSYQLIRHTFYQ